MTDPGPTIQEAERGAETPATATEYGNAGATFSVRATRLVIAAAAVSLVFALFFLANERSPGSGMDFDRPVSVDVSAIGLRALVDLHAALGTPIQTVSAMERPDDLARTVVLLPDVMRHEIVDAALDRFAGARAIVFLLGKRSQVETRGGSRETPMRYGLVSAARLQEVVTRLGSGLTLVRPGSAPTLPVNPFGMVPHIGKPQLVTGDAVRMVLGGPEGALIGRVARSGRTPLYLVADPDPFLNHGLDDGANADLAVAFLADLRGPTGRVAIDDTAAGLIPPPSFWRELFRVPLVALTLTGFAVALVVFMRAGGRFGGVADGREELKSGRGTILSASVALVTRDARDAAIVRRYWRQTVRRVSRRYGAGVDPDRLADSFFSIEQDLGTMKHFAHLDATVRNLGNRFNWTTALSVARDIHTWRTEMLDG